MCNNTNCVYIKQPNDSRNTQRYRATSAGASSGTSSPQSGALSVKPETLGKIKLYLI